MSLNSTCVSTMYNKSEKESDSVPKLTRQGRIERFVERNNIGRGGNGVPSPNKRIIFGQHASPQHKKIETVKKI